MFVVAVARAGDGIVGGAGGSGGAGGVAAAAAAADPGTAEFRKTVEDLTAAALEDDDEQLTALGGDDERLTMPDALAATRMKNAVAIRTRREALEARVVPIIMAALARAGIAKTPHEFAADLASTGSDPGITSLEENRVLVRGVEGAAAVQILQQQEAPGGRCTGSRGARW